MVGHFVNACNAIEEDRLLTGKMRYGSFGADIHGARCLISTAFDIDTTLDALWPERRLTFWPRRRPVKLYLEERFDLLCTRFGLERIQNAVRNRILSNRARRTLSGSAVVQQEQA